MLRNLLSIWLGCLVLGLVPGCGGEMLEYTEVKRIDEKVTEAELQSFLDVIEQLPEKALPEFPPVFAPPPDWSASRTLPVNELVAEEQQLLAERWKVGWLVGHLQQQPDLERILRERSMSLEQFAGLTLALGASLSAGTLREDQDLEALIETGRSAIERLEADTRNFSTLSDEDRFRVLHQAAWITRLDRAQRLKQVPPENLALAAEHRERLAEIFPREFTTNPLDPLADMPEMRGIPFEELSGTGSDADISWSRDEALVGHDSPDPEFTASGSSNDKAPAE